MLTALTGILSAVPAFFGGTAFRVVWGELSSWFTAKQDHQHEMERMRLQDQLDANQHARNLESIKVQADLKVQVIRVKAEADLDKIDAETFGKGASALNQSTGFKFIDAWKSAIQAALATEIMVLLALHYHRANWTLDERGWELAGAVLGLFLADRLLFRRSK